MNPLSTDLAATLAAVLVAVSALVLRAQSHARHEARVRQLREATLSLQRQAEASGRFRPSPAASTGTSLQSNPSQVFPA
jgi:hypothetical protein